MEFAGQNPFEDLRSGPRSVFNFPGSSQPLNPFSPVGDDDFGRESLGIIDINNPDFGRESLVFDPERESLGIVNLNGVNLNLPSINISLTEDDEEGLSAQLNNAMWMMPSAGSINLSGSIVSPSFHSSSLESTLPSRIFSTSSTSTLSNPALNEAFLITKSLIKQLQTTGRLSISAVLSAFDRNIKGDHRRIKSLPDQIGKPELSPASIDLEKQDGVFAPSSEGNSSVFDKEIPDTDLLDRTLPPEELADLPPDDQEEPVKDTEQVFKTIDKLFTGPETLNTPHESGTSSSSSTSSKEALDVLNSLSVILNENPDEKHRMEGQVLISSLQELLGGSRASTLDDSGHSSIECEQVQNFESYEVLDLSMKNSKSSVKEAESTEICAPLDLSTKSKSATFGSPKVLPAKFRNSYHAATRNYKSLGSNCSVSSNESSLPSKFKSKKVADVQKGPLKAVIPVESMRKSAVITSNRRSSGLPQYKPKKTSTPIRESKIKPVAQSTPDTPKATAPSPQIPKQKLNYSGGSSFNSSSLNSSSKAPMRRSVGNLSKPQKVERALTRSNSFGASAGLSKSLSAARDKAGMRKSTGNLGVGRSVLQENRVRGPVKSAPLKKNGKEN